MALVQGKVQKLSSIIACMRTRLHSTLESENKNIKKSVFISQSNDVFTNLALENWLYKNFDFSNHHVLLLTKNEPCIVFGNDQSSWVENNIDQLKHFTKKGVRVAKRISEGPVIYQDKGNLNLTFFTSRACHDVGYNMEILKRALFRAYELKTTVGQNQEVLLRNRKITDSASQIGETNAYQQCSLLVKVDKTDLDEVFYPESPVGLDKDTKKYMNLCDENYRVTVDGVISSIGWEYLRTPALSLKDGGRELANKQGGFHMVNPTDNWFPGLKKIREELSNWDWTFDKTSKAPLKRSPSVAQQRAKNLDDVCPEINLVMVARNANMKI